MNTNETKNVNEVVEEIETQLGDLRGSSSFKTKDEYLTFRKNWKIAYRILSHAIHEQRLSSRAMTSHMAVSESRFGGTMASWARRSAIADGSIRAVAICCFGEGFRQYNPSALATHMIELRKESKILAGQRRAAELAMKEAA